MNKQISEELLDNMLISYMMRLDNENMIQQELLGMDLDSPVGIKYINDNEAIAYRKIYDFKGVLYLIGLINLKEKKVVEWEAVLVLVNSVEKYPSNFLVTSIINLRVIDVKRGRFEDFSVLD